MDEVTDIFVLRFYSDVAAQYISLDVCFHIPINILDICGRFHWFFSIWRLSLFYSLLIKAVSVYKMISLLPFSPMIPLPHEQLCLLELLSTTLVYFLQIYLLMLTSMALLNKPVHLFYNIAQGRSYLHNKIIHKCFGNLKVDMSMRHIVH